MAGTNGTKFSGIREHLGRVIGRRYGGLDVSFDSFPGDAVERDPDAYLAALDSMRPGDIATIFTPDDTHFAIAMAAVERGLHVLAAKPLVKTRDEHLKLMRAAEAKGVLVAMEVHKRWDPIYVDARDRIRNLGDFSFFQSYMSQPKTQLDTFRAWAGKSSDISYYLNAHHIDFHAWAVAKFARPVRVYASAATGVAQGMSIPAEDTITLTVDWENTSGARGTGVYTASWIAPRSDVHSQQRFFYMGARGEVTVDQAHRGYTVATDADGFRSANPLFMKYEPDVRGRFAGRGGYGYRSVEDFVLAAGAVNAGEARVEDFRDKLATVQDTGWVTAILEAGRKSLDAGGAVIALPLDVE
jgi:D-galacturonate reductase